MAKDERPLARDGPGMKTKGALGWLLEENQPSIKYLALTKLLDKAENDPDVQSAKESIPVTGWAADILAKQQPRGWWEDEEKLYTPKYLSTNWMLLILSDLGLTRDILGSPGHAICGFHVSQRRTVDSAPTVGAKVIFASSATRRVLWSCSVTLTTRK